MNISIIMTQKPDTMFLDALIQEQNQSQNATIKFDSIKQYLTGYTRILEFSAKCVDSAIDL